MVFLFNISLAGGQSLDLCKSPSYIIFFILIFLGNIFHFMNYFSPLRLKKDTSAIRED